MPAIVKELTVEATPQRVWGALTKPDEIARWWTDDLKTISDSCLYCHSKGKNKWNHTQNAQRL